VTVEALVAGVVLGLDNFAAALAIGSLRRDVAAWRVVLAFVAFGAGAPIVGALVGGEVSERVVGWGAWLGAGVLALLGLRALRAGWRARSADRRAAARAGTGAGLLLVAAGLSADNLVVGFGLGLHGVNALALALSAGVSVAVLTLAGLRLGGLARDRWESRAQLLAGALLLVLAGAVGLGIG
jgi:putative Mn2+ efflux pump MntP